MEACPSGPFSHVRSAHPLCIALACGVCTLLLFALMSTRAGTGGLLVVHALPPPPLPAPGHEAASAPFPHAPVVQVHSPAATPIPACFNEACLLHDAEFFTDGGQNLQVLTSDAAADNTALALNNDPGTLIFHVRHRASSGGTNANGGERSRPGLFLAKEPYNIVSFHNMGHLIGDDIFPAFHLLHDFCLHELPRSDIWFVLPARFRDEVGARRIVREHFSLLSANPVEFFDDGGSFTVDGGKAARYERLLFGWAKHGYSFMDRGMVVPSEAVVDAFRRRAMNFFQLEERASAACSVLMVVKDVASAAHVFSVANVDELMHALRERTSCSVEKVTWQGLPLQEQVASIYAKRIVVSLMGADLMNCIFQPLHSGIIVPDQCHSEAICVSSREVELWFSRFPSRKVATIPVLDHGISWSGNVANWDVARFVDAVLEMNASVAHLEGLRA